MRVRLIHISSPYAKGASVKKLPVNQMHYLKIFFLNGNSLALGLAYTVCD